MKKRLFKTGSLWLMAAFSWYSPVMAQGQPEVFVNNKLPDVPIKEVINSQTVIGNTSEFRGKILILDFWATFCSPCVAFFPRADSLEKRFNGALKFLPVTTESKKKAGDFLGRMYAINHVKTLSVVNDRVFNEMFPHTSIPYYVWVNAGGKVLAMTGPDEITPEKIQAVLDGKEPDFENVDGSRRLAVDYTRSLFHFNTELITGDTAREKLNIPNSSVRSYAIATGWIPNTKNGRFHFNNNSFLAYNFSIRLLYQIFYDAGYYDTPTQGAFDPDSRHVFEFRDSSILNKITVTKAANLRAGSKEMYDWFKDNSVCFEVVYPQGLAWKEKMAMVKQELDRFFGKPMGFETHVEQRLDSNQRELRRLRPDAALTTKGGVAGEAHDRYSYVQHNLPLDHFLGVLNGYFFQKGQISFVNKSGITAPVDLELNCDMANWASINGALKKYGLYFSQEPAKIDVLVFSDTKTLKKD